jgi:hypothetical protein
LLTDIVHMPPDIYKEKERIGEPDSYDQCGCYVKVKKDGKVREWMIDPAAHRHPEYLDELLKQIYQAIKSAYKE